MIKISILLHRGSKKEMPNQLFYFCSHCPGGVGKWKRTVTATKKKEREQTNKKWWQEKFQNYHEVEIEIFVFSTNIHSSIYI